MYYVYLYLCKSLSKDMRETLWLYMAAPTTALGELA